MNRAVNGGGAATTEVGVEVGADTVVVLGEAVALGEAVVLVGAGAADKDGPVPSR
ncbi:MAG: hypothetical protein MUP76_00310 [Acidimicrobiia bacterium]|nr:hypothetical protein [Acidimicrobiia bacterium]